MQTSPRKGHFDQKPYKVRLIILTLKLREQYPKSQRASQRGTVGKGSLGLPGYFVSCFPAPSTSRVAHHTAIYYFKCVLCTYSQSRGLHVRRSCGKVVQAGNWDGKRTGVLWFPGASVIGTPWSITLSFHFDAVSHCTLFRGLFLRKIYKPNDKSLCSAHMLFKLFSLLLHVSLDHSGFLETYAGL